MNENATGCVSSYRSLAIVLFWHPRDHILLATSLLKVSVVLVGGYGPMGVQWIHRPAILRRIDPGAIKLGGMGVWFINNIRPSVAPRIKFN